MARHTSSTLRRAGLSAFQAALVFFGFLAKAPAPLAQALCEGQGRVEVIGESPPSAHVEFGQIHQGFRLSEQRNTGQFHAEIDRGECGHGRVAARLTRQGQTFSYSATIRLALPPVDTLGCGVLSLRQAYWFAQQSVQFQVRAVGGPVLGIRTLNGGLPSFVELDDGEEFSFAFLIRTQLNGPGPAEQVVTVDETWQFRPANLPPTVFHWIEPAGGSYANPANWDPECGAPPQPSDTAVFAAGNSVSGSSATAGRWVIMTPIDFNGSGRVFSTSTTEPSLTLTDGGSLLLDDGATFESVNAALGTDTSVLASNIIVSGDSSLWKSTGSLVIGDPAGGVLKIDKGGRVDSLDIHLGKFAGTIGRIEVRGIQNSGTEPSKLIVSNFLNVGSLDGDGSGDVLVENGGLLDASAIALVRGSIRVVGRNLSTNARSTLRCSSLWAFSGDPGTQVEVKDGGLLNTPGIFVGLNGRTGRILVNNSGDSSLPPFDVSVPVSGAAWIVDGDITLDGQNGGAELIVDDNGVVICTGNMALGQSASSAGKVTVLDGGSITVENLTVAESGQGEIEIGGGGTLSSLSATVGGTSVNASALVSLEGLPGEAEWDVDGDLRVGVNAGLGHIELVGVPFFGGATLRVSGTLTVGDKGRIRGNGAVSLKAPKRVVSNFGFISPGLSAGKITIEGDYEQPEGGVLVIEVAGTEPGQFDVLHVTGNATLAGTVDLRFIDGFVPQPGDNVDFVVVDGTITGKLTGGTLVDVPAPPSTTPGDADGDGAADAPPPPIAQAHVKWEVTPEGTCRLTVTNVTPLGDAGRSLPPECGAGLCGAGAVPLMPLTLIGLATLKVSRRRRATARSAGPGPRRVTESCGRGVRSGPPLPY